MTEKGSFVPQHGDVGRVSRCFPGGDPYWVVMAWRHPVQAWINVAGNLLPMPRQPDNEDVELLIRDGEPVAKASLESTDD
jgi:hypothetical protein